MGTTNNKPEVFYQLWCYYEREDKWVMEGLFRTAKEADDAQTKLYDDVNTPCMPDWAIVKVDLVRAKSTKCRSCASIEVNKDRYGCQ